ncbi:uncharacterized protein L969DRAFT_87051 [Mixia osmundae IAM 14324]|uniref:Phosphatidate cytidylyltransferase, mitochondrial n=1 Tax=Mixia osmundae (strain CBS 9802 / IAM 14324 / JCM 22182 / KY 12970) TaxID=764103 RepID=G7E6I3_MIXOS|nr:uncharacterized protein L969DRAFT_87051 [Mixia osmundae IAM 14324]KEI40400.1 hypothetical protein L969DRAFT_87051 [Mixia osmundae IAM 14324]GAA98443.1 hypothetical protein E5Q_05129 [Mixia osmundae IAM 14324]
MMLSARPASLASRRAERALRQLGHQPAKNAAHRLLWYTTGSSSLKRCRVHAAFHTSSGRLVTARTYATETRLSYDHFNQPPPPSASDRQRRAERRPFPLPAKDDNLQDSGVPRLSKIINDSIEADVPDLPKAFGANQVLPIQPELEETLQAVRASFRAPIRYAFAYGSGVFKQRGYDAKARPMLDFVFAVSHPSHWHDINLRQNKHHYSWTARALGSGNISRIQEHVGAGIWFNVDCDVQGKRIKYGVISMDKLTQDLLDWQTMYLAGRMQKPIAVIKDDARVRLANQVNLASTIRTALLLLPQEFSEEQLYYTIAGLSYRGDFRMSLGENPSKVFNIVRTQLPQFNALYGPMLASFNKTLFVTKGDAESAPGSRQLGQDTSAAARADLARRLPKSISGQLYGYWTRKWNLQRAKGLAGEELPDHNEGSLWRRIVSDDDFEHQLDKSLQMIIGRPAFSQSLKGVVTAGPLRAMSYVIPKIKKRFSSPPPKSLEDDTPKGAGKRDRDKKEKDI